jgi:hypothetical protein
MKAPDGESYGRVGAFSCQKCPKLAVQIVQFFSMTAGVAVYIIYLL